MYILVPDHNQVTLKPVDIEVEVTGLDEQGYVDVRSDHLAFDGISRGLAAQNRLSGNNVMNYSIHVGVAVLNAYPIPDAWKIDRLPGHVEETAGKLCAKFTGLVHYKKLFAIHGNNTRNTLFR